MIDVAYAKNGACVVAKYTSIVFCGFSMRRDFSWGDIRIGASSELFWIGMVVRASDDIASNSIFETEVGIRDCGIASWDGVCIFQSVGITKRRRLYLAASRL